MQTLEYQGLKVTNSVNEFTEDFLVIEAPLQININNESYTVVMRTPENDFDLITGLLYAEDIYKKQKPLDFIIEKKENSINSIINVNISKNNLGKGYLNKRTLLSVSSCGICGKKDLNHLKISGNKLKNKLSFSSIDISKMMNSMSSFQENFKKSGGSHAAALFDVNKNFIVLREDIGRHNAVDKVIGNSILNNNLNNVTYLLVSGRVSYEIISKAFIAKIPVVVAVSACSSLAVDFAKEFGICLIGFTRNNKMTFYSEPQYLKDIKYV